MNFTSLLVGDLLPKSSIALGKATLNAIQGSGSTKNIFNNLLEGLGQDSQELNLDEMNLSNQELKQVLSIRDLALNQGLKQVKVNLQGHSYTMNTEDLTFKA